jgi:hypothetical protein
MVISDAAIQVSLLSAILFRKKYHCMLHDLFPSRIVYTVILVSSPAVGC